MTGLRHGLEMQRDDSAARGDAAKSVWCQDQRDFRDRTKHKAPAWIPSEPVKELDKDQGEGTSSSWYAKCTVKATSVETREPKHERGVQ